MLLRGPNGVVRMRLHLEIQKYKRVFATEDPMLRDVYIVADGITLLLEQHGDGIMQIMFCNE